MKRLALLFLSMFLVGHQVTFVQARIKDRNVDAAAAIQASKIGGGTFGSGADEDGTGSDDYTFPDTLTVNGNQTLGNLSNDTLTIGAYTIHNASITVNQTVTVSSAATFNGNITAGNAPNDKFTVEAYTVYNASISVNQGVTLSSDTVIGSTATFTVQAVQSITQGSTIIPIKAYCLVGTTQTTTVVDLLGVNISTTGTTVGDFLVLTATSGYIRLVDEQTTANTGVVYSSQTVATGGVVISSNNAVSFICGSGTSGNVWKYIGNR